MVVHHLLVCISLWLSECLEDFFLITSICCVLWDQSSAERYMEHQVNSSKETDHWEEPLSEGWIGKQTQSCILCCLLTGYLYFLFAFLLNDLIPTNMSCFFNWLPCFLFFLHCLFVSSLVPCVLVEFLPRFLVCLLISFLCILCACWFLSLVPCVLVDFFPWFHVCLLISFLGFLCAYLFPSLVPCVLVDFFPWFLVCLFVSFLGSMCACLFPSLVPCVLVDFFPRFLVCLFVYFLGSMRAWLFFS